MNFTQFEKNPVDLLKGKKKKIKKQKNEIEKMSNDLKDLLLQLNRLNRRVKMIEKHFKK